ncbi:uncharacterized protein LOC131943924 [Physella acuta]|uniref:uncharacterized protein LOC131943924 n=1 Tax=Physella acuta TaxID=109671 RepID=UPI0027DAC296|nr:uncharacterized protein LOC131943924 [Physella acuta]
MSRVPKCLMLKEWLQYDDVIKLLESASSSLEYVLAQDLSQEIRNTYKFICTFCPESCQQECKEYRFEEIARHKMRAHLKDHISLLKTGTTDDAKKEFRTKNQLFKGNKYATVKHKAPVPVNKDVPIKKLKTSHKQDSVTVPKRKIKQPKVKATKYTKLKDLYCEKSEKNEKALPKLEHNMESESKKDHQCSEELVKIESIPIIKFEIENFETEEIGDKRTCETQTFHAGKEQETFQYKVATKLFAVDRSLWHTIEKVLDDIVAAEKPSEELSLEDKEKILMGMRQWMDSVQIYDHQTLSRLQDPLTEAEKNTLDHLTSEDWKKLDSSQDSESKLRLKVYARMLLRDYECFPRKLKPKYCRHCGKHYTASTSLYSHLVSLSGIRFWVCSRCKDANMEEATFTRKHSLQYHILKEVGIPRYRCTQPGCSKTHNHTHHQKSHARQHTGEQHYVCMVEGCKGRFSNRNTYSRHLLQFHHVELTRSNQLKEIDEKEARLKVYAARLKARERSKCKRQLGNESNPKSLVPSTKFKMEKKKSAIDENILTAAQHFLTEVKLEEDKAKDKTFSSELNIEKFIRPSASKLLYGIARDVRNTTSSIQEAKSTESMMGGLNLLATVSKYMNAENCIKGNGHVLSADCMEEQDEEVINAWRKENISSTNSQVGVVKSEFVNCNDIEHESGNPPSELKSYENISHDSNAPDVDRHPIFTEATTSKGHGGTAKTTYNADLVNKEESCSSSMKVLTVGNIKLLPFPSQLMSSQPSNLLHVVQTPVSQCLDTNKKITKSPVNENIEFNKNIYCQNQYMSSFPNDSANCSLPVLFKPIGNPSSMENDFPHIKAETAMPTNSLLDSETPSSLHTQKVETIYSTASNNSLTKAENCLPGRIVLEKQLDTCSHLNKCDSAAYNQFHQKHIQVIKVTNTSSPLHLRSVSTLSGKTYIVLTSSGGQNKTIPEKPSNPQANCDEISSSARILPFSEL